MKYSGARIVIECLLEQGVTTVFGYPGGTILNIYDELYKNAHRITHILTAHEQGACHAADGYARSTGKTGVVMATSGPGACNLVTGIATAHMDSVPLVAITCNVVSSWLGKDTFQEVDIAGITAPITKHNYIVHDLGELAGTIREAFVIAQTGRPGAVLIDIPKDITAEEIEFEDALSRFAAPPTASARPGSAERIVRVTHEPRPRDPEIAAAAALINDAKRPLIYAGGGLIASDACAELAALAEKAHIPAAVSLMGKTAIPVDHPLCTGLIGMHGAVASNKAVSNADLIIALGTRFSDRVISNPATFAHQAKILHVDIDSAEINKNIKATQSLVGDLKHILARLIPLVDKRPLGDWTKLVDSWKSLVPPAYTDGHAKLYPRFIYETIQKVCAEALGEGDKPILVTDVGQHQMWAAQFYPFASPRTFLTSGGLGTMGYGMGAAIGAQVGNPERHVVLAVGDGGFRMSANELATVSHYGFPVIILIMNNGALGMVRQWQRLFYGKRFASTTLDFGPDFLKLADAYGIRSFRADTDETFDAAFRAALAERTPALIDCRLDMDELVLPMVPGGKPIDQGLLELA